MTGLEKTDCPIITDKLKGVGENANASGYPMDKFISQLLLDPHSVVHKIDNRRLYGHRQATVH